MIMTNVANNKTIEQCSDFHSVQKRGCSSLKEMIVKVAKSIGEDPALFLKSPEKIEKIKN
jgi:hypothetical protein